MDAKPLLVEVARHMDAVQLEAVLIGNAAAALQGASDLYRIVRDDDGLPVDFMGTIHGIRSFKGLRDRATNVEIDGVTVRVASLMDIIRSKRAARRPRDLAVLDVLEKTLEKTTGPTSSAGRRRPRK